MDIVVLILFCLILIGSAITGISVVAALTAGLVLFLLYAVRLGYHAKELWAMCFSGIRTAWNVLIIMLLVGVMTALWRASGCVPTIVCYAAGFIRPSIFILLTFLLNMLVSILTGTSFGTAATMGVICLSIARSSNMPLTWVGGAMLAGAFFGDRWSPVSSSANLVCSVTGTDLNRNMKSMLRTAFVPTLATAAIYLAVGFFIKTDELQADIRPLFESEFTISWVCLLPAVSILVTTAFHTDVKFTMLVSSAIAAAVAVTVQHDAFSSVLVWMLTGFSAESETLAPMIDGGGITSMLRVTAIILIASCYSGIFERTGLLKFLEKWIEKGAGRMGNYPITLILSLVTCAMTCNQTLSVMLTQQLTAEISPDRDTQAVDLEDSAVIVAPLVPWAIAGAVPLAITGSPQASLLTACFLYLLPLWRCVRSLKRKQA